MAETQEWRRKSTDKKSQCWADFTSCGDFGMVIFTLKLEEQLELTPKLHNVKMQCRHPTEIQNDKG